LKLLREPLLQFFFIGMCIYGAYALYGTPEEGLESNTIVVDSGRIGTFISAWGPGAGVSGTLLIEIMN
jgi:hypothetical protein